MESSTWRLIHVWLGVVALMILFIHTGFSTGGLHTTLLVSCFLGLFILGSLTGISLALKDKIPSAYAYQCKSWFRRLHIAISWPLPALLAAHIVSMYWF